ncbi:MAG: siderophore-interacting protein [Acidimicrobiales bacterium]|nr:siderophore-interacting protein [Acidimicrobiales bacterium]
MSKEIRTHPAVLRTLDVVSVFDVGPRLRRVTLAGTDLGPFERDGITHPGFRSDGPDDHVKVFLAPDGDPGGFVKLPVQADGHLVWPDDHSVTHRDYTVRRHDPDRMELDLEFVLHGNGPGAAWASAATPGSRLTVAGPRTSLIVEQVAHLLLIGDETALPAIARWIEEAPPSTSVTVLVEVDGAQDEIALARPSGVLDLRWTHRATGGSCVEALRSLPPFDEDTFAFAAGEFSMISAARRHLKEERGLPPDRCRVASYWRSGMTTEQEHLEQHRLEELGDLLTPNALRVAATLRLPDLVEGGATSAETLAEAAGGDLVTIEAIVHHLATKDVFTVTHDGRIGLGGLGRLLLDSHPHGTRRRFDLSGAEAHMHAAWSGLLHAATTGEPGYPVVHGVGFWDHLRADVDLARSFDGYLATWAAMWVPSVVQAHPWNRYGHIVDVGGGMGILLAEILGSAPETKGTLVDLAAPVANATWWFGEKGIADRARAVEGDFFEELPSGDAIVLAQVLHDWPDDQARSIAARAGDAAGREGRVIVVERLRGQDGRSHADMTLLMRNLFAATERTETELVEVLADAGLEHVETTPAGDALHVLEFRRTGS